MHGVQFIVLDKHDHADLFLLELADPAAEAAALLVKFLDLLQQLVAALIGFELNCLDALAGHFELSFLHQPLGHNRGLLLAELKKV